MADWRYRSAWWTFDRLFGPWMRHRIHAVRMAGVGDSSRGSGPILICPNHTSWWDGFLVRELQRAMRPRATLCTVMLDEELVPRPFLRLMGAVGLRRGSAASLRRCLRHLRRLREREPDLVVVFFPQGRIWPSFRRPLHFKEGVRLFIDALDPVRVLPLGIHVEVGPDPTPVAYLSAGSLLDSSEIVDVAAIERRVEEEVDAIHRFLAKQGEDAEAAWPGAGSRLPRAGERRSFDSRRVPSA